MTPPSTLDLLLQCAAVDPALGAMVFYDAEPAELLHVARRLAALLEAGPAEGSVRVLQAWHTEDDLWGSGLESLVGTDLDALLVPDPPNSRRVLVVPDLTQISLPVARACTQVVGAEVAHLERHGRSMVFRPRLWWVAGCPLAEIGRVSRHLLDRFAIRIHVPELRPARIHNAAELAAALADRNGPPEEPQWPERASPLSAIGFTEGALRLCEQVSRDAAPGFRLPLTLARTARALVALDRRGGPGEVMEADVRRAGRLLQWPWPAREEDGPQRARDHQESKDAASDHADEPPAIEGRRETRPPSSDLPTGQGRKEPTSAETPPPQELPTEPAPIAPVLQEREAPTLHEHAPLRVPIGRAGAARRGRGAVLGTGPARDLIDLAIVPTVIAALRAGRRGRDGDLVIRPEDFRAYRRSPVPEHLLVMVMDYTCRDRVAWQGAVIEELRRAYVARAPVVLVQVGSREQEPDLAAQVLSFRSVLGGGLNAALQAPAGKASPLADGLDRARGEIGRRSNHGRTGIRHARLVVLSDARGNVPLDASRARRVDHPVGSEGVEDARRVARAIAALPNVEAIVLDPQPPHLGRLVAELAEALEARLQLLPAAGGAQ